VTATSRPAPFRHDHAFDPSYGYDLAALRRIAPPATEPADFAEFWTALHRAARAVEVRPRLGPWRTAASDPGTRVADVGFTSAGGVRIGGWLTVPADGVVERGFVVGHGYGGRQAPDPAPPAPRSAVIYPVARGLGSRSLLPGVPATPEGHVLNGIAARGSYVHGGCAADVWCAASALLELVPEASRRLDYTGGSFGGGIGALALPWDERFRRAHFEVPSFGHHPLRVTLECAGSGAAVRERWLAHPEVLDVLAYFDAATAARHLRIPVQVAAAVFDPFVPPPGQFAVHNALAGPASLHVMPAGHFDHPDAAAEHARMLAARAEFFAE
jgi:cephalosporin-C deacetylase